MGLPKERGNYVCKILHYDIYQKFDYEKSTTGSSKRKVKGHEFDIYHAKKKIEGGFKTKEQAIEKANSLGIVSKKKK